VARVCDRTWQIDGELLIDDIKKNKIIVKSSWL